MLTKLAAITVLPMLLVGGVVANSSIMIVQVSEGADGMNIMVPVPLMLAQVATVFAPDEIKRHRLDSEALQYMPYLARFVDELEALPDVTLVEVRDRDDHVKVSKSGDHLRVQVRDGRGAKVDVNIPMATVRGVVDAIDLETGTIHASRVVGALRAAPSGEFVNVVDGDDRVRIRMW